MAEEHNAIKYGVSLSKGISNSVGGGYSDVGISRMSETLQGVFDAWRNPEHYFPREENLFARFVVSPSVALRFSGIELVNPVGSGFICVAKFKNNQQGAAIDVQMDSGAALGTTATVRGLGRDGRLFTGPNVVLSRCTIVTGDFAAGANTPNERLQPATADESDFYVITPGTKLFLLGFAAAASQSGSLIFRERQAFPGELPRVA